MILSEFISLNITKLRQAGIETAQIDTRLLVCHSLKCARLDLLSHPHRELSSAELTALDKLITRRLHHEPVARIVGLREFWGLEFTLNEATLEPRPDSETIIEALLSIFPSPRGSDVVKILDVGTGTGCLLLALLHEFSAAQGTGIDINPRAVEQAKKNADFLGLTARATFAVGDWFVGLRNTKFDIIVSNPPYIPHRDIATLMPEVRDYDPRLALDGGDDGLASYRVMIPQFTNFLSTQGVVALEVGHGQAPQIVELLSKQGFESIQTREDLGGVERCIIARQAPP